MKPRPTSEVEQTLLTDILASFHGALQDRSEWESRLVDWENQYYNRTVEKVFPWPGSSNFHVPLTMLGVETFKPRLVESILGQTPPILAVPMNAASEDKKDKVEAVLNWQVLAQMKIEPVVALSAHLFLIPGTVVAKTYWKVERRWRKYMREFSRETSLKDIFLVLFGDKKLTNWEQTGDQSWAGEIPTRSRTGPSLGVRLSLDFSDEETRAHVEQETLSELPCVDLIDPPDVIVPVKGGQDIRDLPWFQHRLWMREEDLRAKVAQGVFYEDAVEELLAPAPHPPGDHSTLDSGGYRQSQAEAEGTQDQGPSNARREQWDVIEDYRRCDIDGDGEEEEVITWVCPHLSSRILGWDYLDNVYAHGRRPFRVGRFSPVPFRWYGTPLPEMIKGIQDEINTIHNQRVDYATLQNLPFGFKRASATIPAISERLRPGEFIDIDNPQQDVFIPKWQGSPAWGNQEEAVLHQYFERVLGLSDLSLGRQPNRVGATRTARGTQTLLSEAGLRFKTAMLEFQRFWLGIFSDILALDQEYLPPSQEFRITGRRPTVLRIKDRSEIRGDYEIRLAASSESLNREQMRNDATILMQAMMNPAAIQVGLVGRKGVRRAYEDLLKAYGKDPDFYLEPEAPIRGPEEELRFFSQGQYIEPTMGENIPLHLLAHQRSMQDPTVPPDAKVLILRHIQETLRLQQSQQMAQTLQGPRGRPPLGPQATNAVQGAQPQAQAAPPAATSPTAGLPAASGGLPAATGGQPNVTGPY